MFRSFDKDKDSAISFEEFLLIILSRAESDLRALVSQKDTYYIGNQINKNRDIGNQINKNRNIGNQIFERIVDCRGVKNKNLI